MSLTRRQLLASAALPFLASAQAAPRPPNIVVFLADDLGYGDLACYGSDFNRTPNIDALAAGGLRFTDFHSNGAVCSPTRAALMTGRYQQRCGITDVILAAGARDTGLEPSQLTFPRVLKSAGYRTAIYGKWHLGYLPKFNPDKHGFDDYRGYVSGNVDYFSHVDQAGFADWWHNSRLEPETGYSTELITRHAVRFIEQNQKSPFLLYLPWEAVHSPYQGPHDKALRQVGSKEPAGGGDNVRATYRDMLESMDAGIGTVMETLRRLKLDGDTLVFFFSDNGATKAGSNGRCRGFKAQLWEGGHREPAIAFWPGRVPAGKTTDATAMSMDLFPTVLDAAGVAQPAGRKLDGISLWPHISGSRPLPERTLFWGHAQQRAVRRGPWKLTLMSEAEPFLADLAADFSESRNLAASKPDLVRQLRADLAQWEQSTAT